MSQPCDKIRHSGVITELRDNHAKVCIVRTSACASCDISRFCTQTESKELIIDIIGSSVEKHSEGDKVIVAIRVDRARVAVLYAFCIPLVCMFISFFVTYLFLGSEVVASVFSICSVFPYLWILYLKRETIDRKFSFELVDE